MCTPSRDGYIFIGWFDSSYKDAPLNYYADTYSNLKDEYNYDTVGLYNYYLITGKSRGDRISQYISSDTYTTNSDKTLYAGWVKFNYYREVLNSNLNLSNGYYNDLGTAVGNYGTKVTLLNDVTETTSYTFTGYGGSIVYAGITINLNGHTLTVPSLKFNPKDAKGAASINGPGKITYSRTEDNTQQYLIELVSGDLYIDGGTYASNGFYSTIYVQEDGTLSLKDTESRLVIEASSSNNSSPTAIYNNSKNEFIVKSEVNGMYIYGQGYGIRTAGVLRVQSHYPSGNNTGVEMSVIAMKGYAIEKKSGNVQVGNNYCATRNSCTSSEISSGKIGHYGYGTEMYPYVASYYYTHNSSSQSFSVVYHVTPDQLWFYSGRLVSTITGISCPDVTTYYIPYGTGDGNCVSPFSTYSDDGSVRKAPEATGFRWSTVTNEINSRGDNINGTKLMLYK